MQSIPRVYSRRNAKILFTALIFLVGCGKNTVSQDGVYDPAEPINRSVHSVNKAADRVLLRPASRVYGALPDGVEKALANGASNLSLPSDVVNHTLQGDVGAALSMTTRFLLNSTVGVLGLFDPATALDLPDDSTDFGETLHVWGVGEGPYIEQPLRGPSTARDTAGDIVDFVTNPVGQLVKAPDINVVNGVQALDVVGKRHRLTGIVDPVLYGAADSYSAARIGYLLNRRNVLQGGEINETDLDDPFAFDP